jgi:hypothetical protein
MIMSTLCDLPCGQTLCFISSQTPRPALIGDVDAWRAGASLEEGAWANCPIKNLRSAEADGGNGGCYVPALSFQEQMRGMEACVGIDSLSTLGAWCR